MAKRNTRIRTSSEIPFVPEVFRASYDEPMPIDPPNTSYLTAMPEIRPRLTDVASKEEQHESRWKPLMGTPSKPPVPPNILVPDPSPIRHVADDESPRKLTPSSPDSFIHRRRQGEYVPRPPVWKIYDLPIDSHSSPNGLEDTDTDTGTCESDEDVFTDLKNRNVSSMRPAETTVSEQIRKMADIFSQTPDLVNMAEHADQIVAQSTPDDACLPLLVAADFTVSEPPTADPSEHHTSVHESTVLPQDSDYQNLQRNKHGLLKITSSDMVWQSRLTGSSRDCSAKSNSLIVPCENAATLHQEPTAALRDDQKNQDFLENGSTGIEGLEAHPTVAPKYVDQIPQVSLDFTHPQITNNILCTDIQQPKEFQNPIRPGYLVKFIGDTSFSASQSNRNSELDDKNEFMIAVIYDDGWGLFIHRDSGRKLTCISNAASKGSSCKAEDATVEVVYDETLFCFLPLCSVMAIPGNRFSKEAELFADETRAYSKGGKIQPPPRAHSMAAEAEAKDRGVVVISEAVFKSFDCRCEKPRSSSKLPANISVFRQIPAESPTKKDSGQALPAEPNGAGDNQKLYEKKESSLQRSYGRNLFFARGKDMTLQQRARAKASNAKSEPVHEYGIRHPTGLEGYRARKKAANAILQQKSKQRQREEEGQGVKEVAETKQSETQRIREQEKMDSKGTTPEILCVVSNWLQHPDHDVGEDPLSMVAEASSYPRPSDETAVNPLKAQQLSISTSNNRTVVSWRKIPQGNGDIRPDDCISKKGRGHPETVKENRPFPIGGIGKSIRGSLRGMREKLSLSRGRVSPGSVS